MRTLGWIFVVLIVAALAGGAYWGKTTYDGLLAEREQQRGKITELEARLGRLDADRAESEKRAASAKGDLEATRSELEELRRQRAEAEKRQAAFQALTESFQKMIDGGKVKVLMRRGRMILKMPAGVLFASGSADLSPDGKATLTEVSAILSRQDADRRLMIAGHTDNLPIADGKFRSNWDLSTARAVTVTEFLIALGMKPAQLAAAGYAEHDPVGDNKTEAGLQDNRRIEIELLPPTMDDIVKAVGAASAAASTIPAAGVPARP